MINPQWLKLPMFRTNFHGPKDVRDIEIRLYFVVLITADKIEYSEEKNTKIHIVGTVIIIYWDTEA